MTEVTLHAHMLLSHFCGRGGCGDIIQVMPNPGEDLDEGSPQVQIFSLCHVNK